MKKSVTGATLPSGQEGRMLMRVLRQTDVLPAQRTRKTLPEEMSGKKQRRRKRYPETGYHYPETEDGCEKR